MKDRCILCGRATPYETEEEVDNRNLYIEGAGQLCDKCYSNIYGVKKPEKTADIIDILFKLNQQDIGLTIKYSEDVLEFKEKTDLLFE